MCFTNVVLRVFSGSDARTSSLEDCRGQTQSVNISHRNIFTNYSHTILDFFRTFSCLASRAMQFLCLAFQPHFFISVECHSDRCAILFISLGQRGPISSLRQPQKGQGYHGNAIIWLFTKKINKN